MPSLPLPRTVARCARTSQCRASLFLGTHGLVMEGKNITSLQARHFEFGKFSEINLRGAAAMSDDDLHHQWHNATKN